MLNSRKRSNSEERDDLVVKKRVLSSASGSPVPVNGATEKISAEPEDEKDLDVWLIKSTLFDSLYLMYSFSYCRTSGKVLYIAVCDIILVHLTGVSGVWYNLNRSGWTRILIFLQYNYP